MAATTLAPVGLGVAALGGARARPGRVAAHHARGVAALGATRGDDGMMGARATALALRGRIAGPSLPAARGRRGAVVARAVTGPRETRLGSILTSLPQRVDLYFKVRRGRKLLWKAIFAFTGFYTANVLSLTFGVLGINDVVAGAFCVAFSEIVTRAYYKKLQPGKYWDFLNWFKLGLMYALTADAFKLGS